MIATIASCLLLAFAPAETVRVHVEDAEHHPVAGAWVGNLGGAVDGVELADVREWLEHGARGRPPIRLHCVQTDADGAAKVKVRELWNHVIALTPDGAGHGIVARGTAQQLTVTVAPYRFWRVRVVDPADSNARPRLLVDFGLGDATTQGDSTIVEQVQPDAEGVATFGPVDLVVDPGSVDAEFTATLEFRGLVEPTVRVHQNRLPGEPTLLALPPHGALEVQLVDEDGRPSVRPVTVEVVSNEFLQLNLSAPYAGGWREAFVNEHGTPRLEPIGLGLEMDVAVDDAPRSRPGVMRTRRLDGSRVVAALESPNEVRVVRLVVPDHARETAIVSVHGRALGRGGQPIREHRIGVDLVDTADESIAGTSTRTDADGGFTSSFAVDASIAGHGTLRLYDRGASDREVEDDVAFSSVAIDEFRGWKGAALGDLSFDALPLLFAGTVVDDDGDPQPDAFVGAECDWDSFDGDESIPHWWRRRFDRQSRPVDGVGRLEIHGLAGRQTWKLSDAHFDSERGAQKSTVIPIGAKDAVLVFEGLDPDSPNKQVGAIVGELLLDVGVPHDVVNVQLEPAGWKDDGLSGFVGSGDSSREDRLYPRDLRPLYYWCPRGRYGNEKIPAGTWNLRAYVQSPGQPRREVFRRDGVVIEDGKTLVAPTIDLRGKIKVAQLEIVDSQGAPIPYGHVFCSERSRLPRRLTELSVEEDPDSDRIHAGRFVVCTLGDWPTLEFLGYQCRRISAKIEHAGPARLVLPPRLEVRVRLPDGVHVPQSPVTLDLSMHFECRTNFYTLSRGGEPPTGDSATFDRSGSATVRLPAAAKYELTLRASRAVSGDVSLRRESEVARDIWIEVPVSDSMQTIEVPVTQAEIDAAVHQLGS